MGTVFSFLFSLQTDDFGHINVQLAVMSSVNALVNDRNNYRVKSFVQYYLYSDIPTNYRGEPFTADVLS